MNLNQHYFIIDFDSTFTQVEALDCLCEIAQKNNPNRENVLQKIQRLTDQGMNKEISLRDSLNQRIALLNAQKQHLQDLIKVLKQKVTPSFLTNKTFIQNNASNIYIISNGFKEFISPVVADYGIADSHVYANNFICNDKEDIVGIDLDNPLTENGGKPTIVKKLKLQGTIHVIGDGLTDYEIKEQGAAHIFYAFIENVRREKVVQKADFIANNFNSILVNYKQHDK